MNDYRVVIPARYGSERLPGKVLQNLLGKPMIYWVAERALQSQAAEVVVATDDERVANVAFPSGITVVLTSSDHESGTDRVHEVSEKFSWETDSVIVNVQGDEPLIPPGSIDQVARLLQDNPQLGVSTLYELITDTSDFVNPNVVKVVCDVNSHALYFSRAPIPWDREDLSSGASVGEAGTLKRHIGLYGYRVWALKKFTRFSLSPLEKIERLEQLRFLENQINIVAAQAELPVPPGVDTQEDLERLRDELKPT